MKITKNDALGASGGRCGASRFQNGSWAAHERHSANAGLRICDHFSGKDRFRVPFWTPVDFEGGHKIALFDTMFKKKCKNDT